MSNQISEDIPAPSSSSASAATSAGGGPKEKLEKQARQLAYDVKYKVKQQMNRGTKLDPAAVKKAYLSFLGRATGSPQVKALAKKKLVGEATLHQIVGIIRESSLEKTFKVRVTDRETGNTYVRNATRAKIAELRANKNIASVEMTGYGEPTKSEKTKGAQTAAAKAGKDYDGDKKIESPSKEHAGSVHNAIQKKKGGKQDGQDTRSEAFIADGKAEDEKSGYKKVEELKKGKKNIVKVMPNIGEDAKHGYDKDGNSLNPKDIKKKNEKDPNGEAKKEEEEDPRSMGTNFRNMKNRLRSMGLNMGFESEGDVINEEPQPTTKQIKAREKYAKIKELTNQGKHKEASALYAKEEVDKELESKNKKADQIKKQVLLKKLQAVRAGGGSGITASHHPEGETIEEADSLAAQTARFEANRRRRMKASGTYERPNWIPRDQDHKDEYGSSKGQKKKPQQTHANLQNEEVELTEEFITERVDFATEYFYKQGINPDGLDIIVEELGIDEFTAFVLDGPQELNEDEAAYQKAKKKAIAGSDRREREGKGEYSPKGSSSPYAKQGLGAKTKKKPKIGHTGTKVVAATEKAKKTQPAKPTSREGLGSKIRGFVKKGVERHQKAREAGRVPEKRAKEFASGVKSGVKTAVKFAKDVKKVVSKEEVEVIDELKNSTLLSYSQKATNQLAFKGDGSNKAQKRATGVKRATGKLVARATDPDGSLGYNKNPKNEEVEHVDENRLAAYTAGAGEGSPASRPTVSKKLADRVSRSSDERAFGNRKKKEGIRLSPTKKYSGKDKGKVVKRANTTGRGTPVQYRKSHEDPDMGRYQQKVTQGSGSVKDIKSSFSNWRNELLGEEDYDKMKDARLVNYGIGHDGSDRNAGSSRRTPDNQKIKGKTVLQKQTEKKYGKGVSAMDVVKAKIKAGEI